MSDDLMRFGDMPSPWDDWVSPDGTFLLPEVRIAIWYIAFRGYELLHNGQLVDRNRRPALGRPAPEAMNAIKLQTEFLLDPRVRTLTHPVEELKITSANLKRGYSRALEILKHRRFSTVVDDLNVRLTPLEKARGRFALRQLVETVFETEADLAEAVLLQWILNVKRSAVDLPLTRQLFVLIGGNQAGGKSEFVKAFLGPLEELASAPVSLVSLLREPHASIFDKLGINVDDSEPVRSANDRAKLKRLITSDFKEMRLLRTSDAVPVRLRAQYLGSSNFDLADLFPDPTGLRRFVMLKFRSGDVLRGGTSGVWDAVNTADYRLIWRSVEVDDDSFVEPFWGRLAEYQQANQLRPGLRDWLEGLDVTSFSMRGDIMREGWVKSTVLYGRFVADTGSDMNLQAFGREMKKLLNLKGVPFDKWDRSRVGSVYHVRGYREY